MGVGKYLFFLTDRVCFLLDQAGKWHLNILLDLLTFGFCGPGVVFLVPYIIYVTSRRLL